MASFNTALNPSVVKTALDGVFMPEFNFREAPGYVDATSKLVFNQETSDRGAEIMELFKGVGLWDAFAEEADVPSEAARITNQKTFTHLDYGKSMDIPKNYFDDQMHGAYSKMVKDFAQKGKATRDHNAFAIYRSAFVTTFFTTSDSAALVSDSHTTIGGQTVDNKLTAALSETSLNTAIVALMEQKDQAGVIMGNTPSVLLVPPALYKTACEIVDSELRSGTADNDENVYSSKYNIYVVSSNRLGAAVSASATSSAGSDTAWFLLGRNHGIHRWTRQDVRTSLVDYIYTRNNNYVYKADFREVVGAMSYEGLIGSDGTA